MARLFKLSGLAVLVLGISTMAYAFTAGNTVSESAAGDGTNTVSGYTVTGITYDLDSSDPTLVDKVTFTVTPTGFGAAATEVKAKVTGGAWTNCTGGGPWECDFSPNPTVASISSLQVVAAQ